MEREIELPMLEDKKPGTLTERITLPVEKGLKEKLVMMKEDYKINVPELLRQIIWREVNSLDFSEAE